MQIQCSHCESRYKIDPDKLPKGASFVRCTNCQKPIFLQRPDQGGAGRVIADCPKCHTQYAIPQAHFQSGAVTAHCKKCDNLFQIDEQGKTFPAEAAAPAGGKAAKSAAAPAPAAKTADLDEEMADDLGDDLGDMEEASLDEGDLAEGLDDADFGGGDDLGGLEDHEIDLGDDNLDEVEIHDETNLGDDDMAMGDEALDFQDEFDHEADDLDELGDLKESDFTDADADEEYLDSVHMGEADALGVGEEITLEEKGMFLGAEPVAPKGKAKPQPTQAKAKAKEPAKTKAAVPKKAKKGGWFKWVALLLLTAGGAGYWAMDQGMFNPFPPPGVATSRDPNAPKISIIGELDGKMIHNQSLGRKIFVLQGSVKNLHRSDEIIRLVKIQGELFDSQQRMVASNMGYAGMIMTQTQLSTFSEAELKAQATDLARISEIQLGSGLNRHMAFQIVFLHPPAEIHGLQAKILSYQKNGESLDVER